MFLHEWKTVYTMGKMHSITTGSGIFKSKPLHKLMMTGYSTKIKKNKLNSFKINRNSNKIKQQQN